MGLGTAWGGRLPCKEEIQVDSISTRSTKADLGRQRNKYNLGSCIWASIGSPFYRDIVQLVERQSGGLEAAGSSPAISTTVVCTAKALYIIAKKASEGIGLREIRIHPQSRREEFHRATLPHVVGLHDIFITFRVPAFWQGRTGNRNEILPQRSSSLRVSPSGVKPDETPRYGRKNRSPRCRAQAETPDIRVLTGWRAMSTPNKMVGKARQTL